MKKTRLPLLAVIAVMLILTFTACGQSFDPVAYIQGSLDSVFHGEIDEEFVDSLSDVDSVEEFQAMYDDIIDTMTDETFTSAGLSDPDPALREQLRDAYVSVFKATKYEVTGEYTGNEDEGYKVEVIAYPLQTFNEVLEDEDGSITAVMEEKYAADSSMSTDDLLAVYVEQAAAKLQEAIANPTYGEAKTYNLTVALDDDGVYNVDEDEIAELTTFLLGE
jgi:hypothetical protein